MASRKMVAKPTFGSAQECFEGGKRRVRREIVGGGKFRRGMVGERKEEELSGRKEGSARAEGRGMLVQVVQRREEGKGRRVWSSNSHRRRHRA